VEAVEAVVVLEIKGQQGQKEYQEQLQIQELLVRLVLLEK
jgi:hypothetical protein